MIRLALAEIGKLGVFRAEAGKSACLVEKFVAMRFVSCLWSDEELCTVRITGCLKMVSFPSWMKRAWAKAGLLCLRKFIAIAIYIS